MLGSKADCFSLLFVTALLLRDLVLFRDEDRGGGVGSSVFAFLVFCSLRLGSGDNMSLEDDGGFWLSLTTGNFEFLLLTFEGTGTVWDLLLVA